MKSSIIAITMMALFTNAMSAEPEVKPSASKRNPVIAHRGAWKAKGLPENSIASLEEAIRIGCYGSEFDIHMTLDSVLVVNHDPEFLGLTIASLTYNQLMEKKMSNGESIPTLEAYLKVGAKQKKTKLILEIKPSKVGKEWDLKMTDKAVAMVKMMKVENKVDYISFSYDILKHILTVQPKANVAYLAGDVPLEQLKKDKFYGADYHYSVYQKGEWFAKAKELGLTINAWTVNDLKDMKWLLENKVDFITTNEPELLFETIAASNKSRK